MWLQIISQATQKQQNNDLILAELWWEEATYAAFCPCSLISSDHESLPNQISTHNSWLQLQVVCFCIDSISEVDKLYKIITSYGSQVSRPNSPNTTV